MRKSVICGMTVGLGLGLGLCGSVAQAALAPGTTGNGELFLNVVDDTAKVSYVLDLGIFMDAFFQDAQDNSGYQRFWPVDSTAWSGFLAATSLPNLRWSVVAIDSTGSNVAGAQRLFTTVLQSTSTTAPWARWTNQNFSLGIGATQAGNFFNAINTLLVHQPSGDYSVNADSFSLETDPGRSYYGESGGLTPSYNGTTTLNATNQIGRSSWFYYLTRSSTSQIGFVIADEFDNGNSAPAIGPGNDGYWGFVRVNNTDPALPFYDPGSPYAGKYVLSFTLAPFSPVTTLAVREFAAGIGRTEYSGGFWVESLAGAAAASSEGAAGWVRTLGAAGGDAAGIPLLMTTPVPEPGRVALTLLGLAAVGGVAARRRQQAKTLGGN